MVLLPGQGVSGTNERRGLQPQRVRRCRPLRWGDDESGHDQYHLSRVLSQASSREGGSIATNGVGLLPEAGIVGMMLKKTAALALVLSAIASPVAAQAGGATSFEDMLRSVPADGVSRGGLVSYVDLRAVEAARLGARSPSTYDEWQSWRETDEDTFDQWIAAYRGVIGGAPQLMQAFPATGADWPRVVGFDYFDVDRMLSFGVPPEDAIVLAGRFDPAAIGTAYEARGFSTTDQGQHTLICSSAGCDAGTEIDIEGRDPADPFGGMMGRKQPLLVSEGSLLSSASFDVIGSLRAAADGDADSLADTPEVVLALGVLDEDARLRQASLASPQSIRGDPRTDAPGLPPYDLVLFADTATSTEQIAHVVLVYGSSSDAQAALEALPVRISEVGSGGQRGSIRTQLDQRGLTDVDVSLSEAADGSGAAVDVSFRAPLAGLDPTSIETGSSELYRHLISSLGVLDAAWLIAAEG
jgi:hypothetical protein